MNKQLSLFDINVLESGDFKLKKRNIQVKSSDIKLIDEETGEKATVRAFVEKHEIEDKTEFLKLFAQGYAFLFDVTQMSSIHLLASIMKIAQQNKDTNIFALSYELAVDNGFKQSQAQYSRAKKELENKSAIIKMGKYYYKYNASMFFNGDRMALIKEFVLKK